MDFVNEKLVKVIPECFGNRECDEPAAVYVPRFSAVDVVRYSATLKEKNIKDIDQIFCLIVEKVENFYLVNPIDGTRTEASTPEQVVNIPGIAPLITEVVDKFIEINSFQGDSKNVLTPSTV